MNVKVQIRHENPVVAIGLTTTFRDAVGIAVLEGDAQDGVADVIVGSYDAGLAVVQAATASSRAAVLIVTANDHERDIRAALDAGVRGYVLLDCSVEELRHSVCEIARGARQLGSTVAQMLAREASRDSLTRREADVLPLLAQGMPNKIIARQLEIGVGTVKTHVAAILEKLGATSRTQAAALASHRGLVDQRAVQARV